MGHSLLRFELTIGQHLSRRLVGWRIHKVTRFFVRPEQRLDCFPQRGITVASVSELRVSLSRREGHRRVKNLFEVFPVLVGHMKSLRQAYTSQQFGIARV